MSPLKYRYWFLHLLSLSFIYPSLGKKGAGARQENENDEYQTDLGLDPICALTFILKG